MRKKSENAQKNGDLYLGYGGDEDEPCERCKNCIKCECGYYQLGETEKDDQFTKAKEILREYIRINLLPPIERKFDDEVKLFEQAEQFLKEE